MYMCSLFDVAKEREKRVLYSLIFFVYEHYFLHFYKIDIGELEGLGDEAKMCL